MISTENRFPPGSSPGQAFSGSRFNAAAPERGMFPHIFYDAPERTRGKIAGLYAILVSANIGVWLWALAAFQGNAFLLGTAFLAYSFGLRHAFDADHIAAIDNITRKLM